MKTKTTKQQLKRELEILKATEIYRLTDAYKAIDRCNTSNYMASGITFTVKNINKTNNVVCEEFCILDGLSDETITAIKNDIKRSYDLKMSYIQKI